MLIQRLAVNVQKLQIRTTRIGCTAQDDDTPILPLQVGLDGIKTHVRIDGDCISAVALESLTRILFGGGTDVTALGVEHDGYLWIPRFQIITNRLQLIFCSQSRKVGNLRLESAGGRCGRINDRLAKSEDGITATAQSFGKPLDIRIKADAEQRIIGSDGGSEFVSEFHASWQLWWMETRL